jgi:hypothetical protein
VVEVVQLNLLQQQLFKGQLEVQEEVVHLLDQHQKLVELVILLQQVLLKEILVVQVMANQELLEQVVVVAVLAL